MSAFGRGGAGNRADLAAAQAAAAEREAMEDTDTWDTLSDDEDFARRAAAQPPPHNPSAASSKPEAGGKPGPGGRKTAGGGGPGPKRTASYSGSGRGFWDIPGGGRGGAGGPHAKEASKGSRSPGAGLPASKLAPLNGAEGVGAMPRAPVNGSTTVTARDQPGSQGGAGSKAQELQRTKSSLAEQECRQAIRADVDDLIEDPLNALARLKLAAEADMEAAATSAQAVNPVLPWEAVLPPELVSPPSAPSALPPPSSAGEPSGAGPPAGSVASSSNARAEPDYALDKSRRRLQSFLNCLSQPSVPIADLRKLAWSGIPDSLRPMAWQLLLGYLPAPSERRKPVLKRKRQEYADSVKAAFAKGEKGLDATIWHQIRKDVPRTNPGVPLWQISATQRSLERILYVWAIRHPASGYVQGINDLVTPFFQVFLSSYIDADPETFDVGTLPQAVFEAIEADSFWSLSKLLDGIQDNYTFAQPGIQRQVARMKELCKRVDAPLYKHLEEQNVEFIQFAFRWMNCLLMRELSTKNIIRMWDTYLAEGTSAFSEFHLYVCLAFLVRWSEPLRQMDFQAIIIFLQSLPTQEWSEENTELLLSEAFMWSSLFQNASGHFLHK